MHDADLTLTQANAWFIACHGSALRARPLALTLQGAPLVLFRDAQGQPHALDDRCPHRNVPLSTGRVTPEGQIECRYHGWQFDGAGRCVEVPGLVDGPADLRARCVASRPTCELDGYVWVAGGPAVPSVEPLRFPPLRQQGYTTVRREFRVAAPMHSAIENTLDVPHTAFLHSGLFRSPRADKTLQVTVHREGPMAEARFSPEPRPAGLVGWLLAPRGGLVEHTDRFTLPGVAQVEYRLGASHLLVTTHHTPVTPFETRLFVEVTFKAPVPGWLVRPFVTPVATAIFRQDATLLAQQAAVLQARGVHYTSTALDVLGPQVLQLLRASAAQAPLPPAHTHEVQLRL